MGYEQHQVSTIYGTVLPMFANRIVCEVEPKECDAGAEQLATQKPHQEFKWFFFLVSAQVVQVGCTSSIGDKRLYVDTDQECY